VFPGAPGCPSGSGAEPGLPLGGSLSSAGAPSLSGSIGGGELAFPPSSGFAPEEFLASPGFSLGLFEVGLRGFLVIAVRLYFNIRSDLFTFFPLPKHESLPQHLTIFTRRDLLKFCPAKRLTEI